MKNLILTICLFTGITTLSQSQTPTFTWAKLIGGKSYDYLSNIAVSSTNTIYVSGFYNSDTLQLDSLVLLNNSAGTDLFVARYDSAGHVIWAKRAGGNGEAGVYDIAADPQGNCYMTGFFNSSNIIFGTDTFYNPQLAGGNFFLVKYDSSGNVL